MSSNISLGADAQQKVTAAHQAASILKIQYKYKVPYSCSSYYE
jgi:hypothetical protein